LENRVQEFSKLARYFSLSEKKKRDLFWPRKYFAGSADRSFLKKIRIGRKSYAGEKSGQFSTYPVSG